AVTVNNQNEGWKENGKNEKDSSSAHEAIINGHAEFYDELKSSGAGAVSYYSFSRDSNSGSPCRMAKSGSRTNQSKLAKRQKPFLFISFNRSRVSFFLFSRA